MALNTYQQLLDAIPAWLHRTGDIDVVAAAPDFVRLAETEIYARVRTKYQELNFAFQMQSGIVGLPDDYTDVKWAYIDSSPIRMLTRASVNWLLEQYPYRSPDRRPEFFARDGISLIFGPYPDTNYFVKGVYYIRLPDISGAAVNGLFSAYPKMFLYGALCQAESFVRNDPAMSGMIQIWREQFTRAMEEAQLEDDRESISGGGPRVRVIGYAP